MDELTILGIIQVVKARISEIAAQYIGADAVLREEVTKRLQAEGDHDSISWINQLCKPHHEI